MAEIFYVRSAYSFPFMVIFSVFAIFTLSIKGRC